MPQTNIYINILVSTILHADTSQKTEVLNVQNILMELWKKEERKKTENFENVFYLVKLYIHITHFCPGS
jgi:hypothetical protein